MKLLLLTYLFFVIQLISAQDSRDFYGSNTYFEVQTLNDSIYDLYKSRDVLLDSKTPVLSLSINDTLIQFTNKLDKSDKKILTDRTYSIRVKTNGYHFECLDKPNYLYTVDNLKLTDIKGATLRVKASYKIFRIEKNKQELVSAEDVFVNVDKDDIQGVLFGNKYTYDPKDNLKKSKRKDIAKVTSATIGAALVGGIVFYYRAKLFPSIF